MSLSNHKKHTILASILALTVVSVVGIWSSIYVGNRRDSSEREGLLLRAGTISKMVDHKAIRDLSGGESDLTKPSYEKFKSMFEEIHKLNTDTRFVYLMGLRDGNQFFYVDSEKSTSPDYSPPGQLYADATPTDIFNHINAIPYTNGPYSDQWGTWISAYAPVVDKETQEVLAIVGMDVDADGLTSKVWLAQKAVLAISILVLLVTLLLITRIRKSDAYSEELEKANQDLSADKDYLLEVEHIARLGQITWNTNKNEVAINKIVMDLVGAKQSKVSLDSLLEYVNRDDISRIKKEIESIHDDASFMTLKYRVTSPDKTEHSMVSLCKIKRDPKGAIMRVVCTAQDIGDTHNLA